MNLQTTQELPPYVLHVEMLKGINLALYPMERTHYLAYALQFGLKPASKATMDRSERKKNYKPKVKKAEGVESYLTVTVKKHRKRKVFILPNRFGDLVGRRRLSIRSRGMKRGLGMERGRGRGKQFERLARKHAAFLPGRAIPGRIPISLPGQIIKKQKKFTASKERINFIRTHSPESLQLRAERERFREEIEKYRVENKSIEQEKALPEYFRKKKANQKRRRLEKHNLIKANKEALLNLFGDAVLSKGWPISRKEIKLALGIKQEDHENEIQLEEFMRATSSDMKE